VVTPRNLADMPGMDRTILETVRSFQQGPEPPASAVLSDMRISLPVPVWAEAAYVDNITSNYTAGQTISLTVLQIPANERAWLYGVQATRVSGDNTVSRIRVVQPAAYGSGARAVELLQLGTGTTVIFWPDPGGKQTIDQGMLGSPMLLEPLAIVQMTSDGAGAAGTAFDVQVVRHRIKLTRAEGPE